MRHKSICPVCGELKYLHSIEISNCNGIVWICKDCDKPIEVRFTRLEKLIEGLAIVDGYLGGPD